MTVVAGTMAGGERSERFERSEQSERSERFEQSERSERSEGQARWERSPEVLWRRLSDGVAVLPRDGSAVVTLVGLHAEVWGALGRPVTVGGLVELLGDRLGPDRSARQRNVAESVHFLVAAGAVRESPGGTSDDRTSPVP